MQSAEVQALANATARHLPQGHGVAAGIAMTNALANISGIIGLSITGALRTTTGRYTAGTAVMAVFLVLSAVGALAVRRAAARSAQPATRGPEQNLPVTS
ncbi:putative tartrate transporter [Streptomyces sp. MBT84]|uniref:hypothetical protein n=1 Tax=Streptomyces sp. MBT84 TaxID=1488414 RepID=UPI001C6E995D|nr:hypothetical protein [Streptomyces sp. MBT84]MBW8699823.1 putative tartrate transporter [Streptomyces sp. MBT84]